MVSLNINGLSVLTLYTEFSKNIIVATREIFGNTRPMVQTHTNYGD